MKFKVGVGSWCESDFDKEFFPDREFFFIGESGGLVLSIKKN